MPDMLVKLYELPDTAALYKRLESEGIKIMRPMTPNKSKVTGWVHEHFGDTRPGWADEISTAFSRFPVSCFIAYNETEKKIIGFAGYDCTCRGFFGPMGVDAAERKNGVGGALFLRCMEAMREEGYGYAIIGSAGPTDFYNKMSGATIIEDSVPGIYKDLI